MYHPPEGASPWTPALATDLPGAKLVDAPRVTGKGKGKARADDMDADRDGDELGRDRGDPFIAVRSVETGIIDVSYHMWTLRPLWLADASFIGLQVNLMVQECAGKRR